MSRGPCPLAPPPPSIKGEGHEFQQDVDTKLRLPRSYYSVFKDKSNFKHLRTIASLYCLDKCTALQGYLSYNPPLDTEIFHNAGITKCCERSPPSVNDCIKKKRSEDLKNLLNSLPKVNYKSKVDAWFGKVSTELPRAIIMNDGPISCTSASGYYQSDFMEENLLGSNEISHLHKDEFLQFTVFFFLLMSISFSFCGFFSLLFSTMIFSLLLGKKNSIILFSILHMFRIRP